MKRIFLPLFCSVFLTVLFLPQDLRAGTVLQISAEPGISIWLNKELIGKTTLEDNGLVVRNLASGDYILKAAMPGYDPAESLLSLEDNATVEWRITLAKPVMKIEDIVSRIDTSLVQTKPVGTVILRSIPLNAELIFDNAPVGKADKKLSYVPAADHSVKFVLRNRELTGRFSLEANEILLLTADFNKGEVFKESAKVETPRGPDIIKMQTARKRKPALFPHRKHQSMFGCENCHHGMDNEGRQEAYSEGMEIKHCVTCHNPAMENSKLNSLMLAAHAKCKGCHKKIVTESGTAGPIDKCIGCHNVPGEE